MAQTSHTHLQKFGKGSCILTSRHVSFVLAAFKNHLAVCPQRGQDRDLHGECRDQSRMTGRRVPSREENTRQPHSLCQIP